MQRRCRRPWAPEGEVMRLSRRKSSFWFGLRVLGLALCFICPGNSAIAQNPTLSAQAILQRVMKTYANVSSYQDSGVVRLVPPDRLSASNEPVLRNASLQSDSLVEFKTYYLWPNRIRFEWKNSKEAAARLSVVWFDGKQAYLWMPTEPSTPIFELTSTTELWFQFDRALSSSLGSVLFVPTLMLKNVTDFADILRTARQVSIEGEDLIDGESCYRIKAELSGVPWLLWIGKESFLLRKSKTSYSAGRFDVPMRESFIAEEIHTNICLNRRLPESLFRYRPLLGAQDLDMTNSKARRPLRKKGS